MAHRVLADGKAKEAHTAAPNRGALRHILQAPLWWFAPFLDASSFGKEATDLLLALLDAKYIARDGVHIGLLQMSCADSVNGSMDVGTHGMLMGLRADPAQLQQASGAPAVVICHNMPPFMGRPTPQWKSCNVCPPAGSSAYTIARAMSETTRVPPEFVRAVNSLDEVWVPSEFSRQALAASGVAADKLHVVPPTINTSQLNPDRVPRMSADAINAQGMTKMYGMSEAAEDRTKIFRFVSVFKWEERKGWDALLSAYCHEFSFRDHVALYLITQPFSQDADITSEIHRWVNAHMAHIRITRMPRVYVSDVRHSASTYISLLASMDAFVLPTRGEGFGLPIVEAMALGLPVIATKYSGVASYLDSHVGYPIEFQEVDVPDTVQPTWFRGGQWAEPDVGHLRHTMREVFDNREAARLRGAQARERVLDRLSPEVIAVRWMQELKRVERHLLSRQTDMQ